MLARTHRGLTAITLAGAMAASLAACGSSGGSGSSDSSESGNKTVLLFGRPSSNTYIAEWQRGAEAEAKKLGFTLKIKQSADQNEQNNQVQQQLASGSKPALYGWWPADEKAGLASLRQLDRTDVPIAMANVEPSVSAPYVKFYAGTHFQDNGEASAQVVVAAREAAKAAGVKLHSTGGNLLVVSWPEGWTISQDKREGFDKGIQDKGFNLLSTSYADADDNASGYKAMSAAIPQSRSKGIDFVWVMNDALAVGVIQALKEAGYHPGKDVFVIGANCHGDLSPLQDGEQFGSMLVAARLEGQFWAQEVGSYLKAQKVTDGVYRVPADADAEPELPASPSELNYLPQVAISAGRATAAENQQVLDSTKLWGENVAQACSY